MDNKLYISKDYLFNHMEFLQFCDTEIEAVPWWTIEEADFVAAEDFITHAHWIETDYFDHFKTPIYICSNCRKEVADNYIKNHKYCLHCGAKMNDI